MLPLLLMLSSIAAALSCGSDFSGNYVLQGEDGRVYVSISQTDCTRVDITWKSSLFPNETSVKHHLVLDGQFHSDPGWFGIGGVGQSAASLTEATLEITTNPGRYGLRLRLLPDGDLCINGESRAARLRNRGGEDDDAAKRSQQGCSVK